MTLEICTNNEKINEDIKLFSPALSNDGELIGERLSTLSRLLKEMGINLGKKKRTKGTI
jgi:hypothetical protein